MVCDDGGMISKHCDSFVFLPNFWFWWVSNHFLFNIIMPFCFSLFSFVICRVVIGNMDSDIKNIKKWVVIYPVYINSKKTIAEGRRINASKACENPTCVEIYDCCNHLKVPCAIEVCFVMILKFLFFRVYLYLSAPMMCLMNSIDRQGISTRFYAKRKSEGYVEVGKWNLQQSNHYL